MPKVIGVKFKKSSRTYYFEAGSLSYAENDAVIVETAKGTEIGTVCMLPTDVEEDKIVSPLKPVERKATAKDLEQVEKLEKKREDAFKIAAEKIAESKLDMKLTDCEYTFDGNKLIIYFTAENRVDFRDLVKELASAFHVRIELRQIGARDECKMLGGLGPCGRPCCCANHMNDYAHVTIKMAKNQNLSLNSAKINGLCGRLMCCLSYENEVYVEQNKKMPQMGHYVTTTDGKAGIVVSLAPLREKVRIRMMDGDKTEYVEISASDVETSVKPDNSMRNRPQKTEEKAEQGEEGKRDKPKFNRPPQGEKTEQNENQGDERADKRPNSNRDKKDWKNRKNGKQPKNKEGQPNPHHENQGQGNPNNQNRDGKKKTFRKWNNKNDRSRDNSASRDQKGKKESPESKKSE